MTIHSDYQSGMFHEMECSPIEPCQYWEIHFVLDIGISHDKCETVTSKQVKCPRFSNYTKTVRVCELKDDVDGVVLNFKFLNSAASANLVRLEDDVNDVLPDSKRPDLQVFEFTKEALFDEPIDNITDFKLIVEGQTLYVCKKILATSSSYFYKLFYNDYGSNKPATGIPPYSRAMYDWFDNKCNKTEMIITDRTCNSVRVFLGLLYGNNNLLTEHNFSTIARLACRYEAEKCLENLEHFLNNGEISRERREVLSKIYELNLAQEGITFGRNNQQNSRFTKQEQNLTDMVLSVGFRKFHVSKQLLAYHSCYFNTMFYSDFVEKGKEEVELKEIDANEFKIFLAFVYHPNRVITVVNVRALLELSQMYDVQSIVGKCVKFLKDTSGINEIIKIKISTDFNIPELFDHVLSNLHYSDLPRVRKMEGFNELEDSTVEKLTKLLTAKKRNPRKFNNLFARFKR